LALTIGQIAGTIRRRLGWPSTDTFVSDDELFEMVRESQRELLDLLISVHQGDFLLSAASFTTTAGLPLYLFCRDTTMVPAPVIEDDVTRVRRVSVIFNDRSFPMKRFDIESYVVNETSSVVWDESTDIRYRFIIGGQADSVGTRTAEHMSGIIVSPTPADEYTIKVWYHKGLGTTSVTDAINVLGNDEYLVLDGMIKCLEMEETDTSSVERKKARFVEMLQNNQPPVDAGQAHTILDMRSSRDSGGSGWWP